MTTDRLTERIAEVVRLELAKGVYEIPGDPLPRWTKAQEIATAVRAVLGEVPS